MSFALYTAALLPQGNPLFGKHANITKRQIGTDTLGQRSGTLYTIEVTLGTPGQKVPVQFDTGSSELWVNPVCSKSTTPDFCNTQPRFTASSTLVDLDAQGHVTYGTGYTDFEYVADYVAIGSAKITQQIFGVAFDSAHAVVGLMGAGPSLEGWSPADAGYPLVVDSLAEQGLTNSRAFSMDLRGFDSARGSVIFGGIDTKKYSGTLVKRPIIPAAQSPDGLTRFWVYVNGISVNQPDGTVVNVYSTPGGGKGQPVLLDSGYTLSALPSAIMQKLVSAFPSAQYVPSAELYTVDCLDPGLGGSLDFTFGDKVINVRYYDFVWHVPDSDLCILGAFEDDFPVLGDTFLRSAYVVYDWDNRMIHLGQSEDCGSKLVAIGSGPDAVPSVAGECGQATSTSTTSTSTSTSTRSTSTTVSDTSTTTSSDATSTTTTKSSTATKSSTTVSSTASDSSSSTTTKSSTTSGSTSSTATSTDGAKTSTTGHPSSTSTITTTTSTTYTITSCPPTVAHCPLSHVTTEVVTVTTAICPETTATYTFHKTLTCSAHDSGSCPSGSTKTTALTVTVSPLPPTERTTHVVPGCTPGATGPSVCAQCGPAATQVTTLVAAAPTAGCVGCPSPSGGHKGNSTVTATVRPTGGVVTAGADRVGVMYGVVVVMGGLMVVMGL
ncbi:aspartic peptidase domain-containing protein [Parachaetomium inaequale]|uniref:Aspartic peptidase domain-containing protein n=1 Tax=Parachaetomium inaequale TaxID=2588326 RepID=A0AAN6PEN0_9PEZI|nr:aspartic peptidase domain-containing protein [Parachaetomium inaequale]